MRGRKPALKIIEGNANVGPIPSPPSSLDKHGKAEWKRVAPILHGRGHLDEAVIATLESYCRSVALCRIYNDILDQEGHVLTSEKGKAKHPAFNMLMSVMREQRLLAAELSLTPHRKRGGEPAEGGGDGWDSDLLA
ncbi:phage terminase small subunit P27 family [Acuticoccus sediminis]|uniref:Phage terminase small subunit P27 family n=1 Tax=Acuticoccus sediminis TaxID=2184697 RepID=A0A8B2NU49_9HYPH|nr:phage terminase small subunit P27 family [Acuticoccus sediminis]RAH99859.1 phage terminase small subunit P27 family [Acuticoccus sediminis]